MLFPNPYKRELQIADHLVTMRWIGIPVIFSLCLIFIQAFNMSFKLEPIYIICCVMAVFNIYLTLHISMMAKGFEVTKGMTTLKRLMLKIISQFFGSFRNKGLLGLTGIPKVVVKLASVLYLMILETLRDFTVNPLSLNSIMHSQIIFDLAVILCLTRYTGSTESPMFFLAAIPIAVAGSVMNYKAGIIYALIACGCWFGNSMLIKYGFLPHIKFYSPMYGDLHNCDGWISSYLLVSLVSLGFFAIISHKLNLFLKEKTFELNDSLSQSISMLTSYKHIAMMQTNPWVVLDSKNKILKLGNEDKHLLNNEMIGKSILDSLPDLIKSNYELTYQSVLATRTLKKLEDVKIKFKDNSEHIYDLMLSYYNEYDNSSRLMLCFLEKTLEVNRKELVDTLRAECVHSSNSLERLSRENAELHKSIEDLSRLSSDKSTEIEALNNKINDMNIESTSQSSQISSLMDKLAYANSHNDQLKVELENRQMILDDVADFMASAGELNKLVKKVEQRTKDLFGLENSCFHIFDSSEASGQKNEILDMRRVSPRLLDIPRNNPDTLDPALTEGRPVVFSAEFRPEKSSASIAITNGNLRRLVAFVPLKEDNKILGMMMLEKYGINDNPESIVDMVSFYLKQASGAIKNAINNEKNQHKSMELHQEIISIHNKLDSVKTMIFNDYSKDIRPFAGMLFEISKLVPLTDAVLVRIHNDGSLDICSRIDRSNPLNLNPLEEKVIERIKSESGKNKITFKTEDGLDTAIAYPLIDKDRIMGVLFLYLNEDLEKTDSSTINFCVCMLKNQFALHVLNEEKEVWESFYNNKILA